MGRFDAISTIIRMAFEAVGIQPQPWMAVVAVAAAMALAWPSLQRNARTARARKLVPRLVDHEPPARRAAVDEILRLVAGNPEGLVSVVDVALKNGQRPLAVRAYESLRTTPKAPRKELLRLDEALYGPPPRHPHEEEAAIERLLEAGALEGAATRCRRARAWFPTDQGLQHLEARITAGPGPA